MCLKHAIKNRERSRKLKGSKRRYKSMTYRIAEEGTLSKQQTKNQNSKKL